MKQQVGRYLCNFNRLGIIEANVDASTSQRDVTALFTCFRAIAKRRKHKQPIVIVSAK